MKKFIFALVLVTVMVLGFSTTAQDLPPVPTLPMDHPFAAFIDSHNYAIAQGATAEWRKLEWLAVDAPNNLLYLANTTVGSTMADDQGDLQLTPVPCGVIYAGTFDAEMNITRVEPVIMGGPLDEANTDNQCSVDSIAGPDNLYVDPAGGLWIGEDTDTHLNNVLWMWNGSELKRFATVPLGAEVTGLHITADGTLFMNIQHPDDTNQEPYTVGTIGVIRGFTAGEDFESLTVPETDEEKTTLRVAAGEYQVLARSGDEIPSADGAIFGTNTTHDGIVTDVCNDPDGNMFLPMSDTEAVLYTNFECGVGGVSQLNLAIDTEGNLSVVSGLMLDFIPVNGTANNCGASVTPWNTALTSEEYPADNEEDWQYYVEEQAENLEALIGKKANPFDYGYQVELTYTPEGTQIVKRYAMGRFSHEVAIVMPDQRTVYFGDDGTDRVFYKFVADVAGDLSAGTLYAAKVTQDGEAMNLEWIMLGQGNEADILAAIRELDSQFAQ